MPRISAWNGTHVNNKRPYVTVAPDVFVSIQGETFVTGCGECKKKIPINDYLTGISVDATVDSPPGSASISLTIPDNSINDFYVENQLVIIPMMEVEIFSKGYYLIGGVPQYYKIFWGLITQVQKSWSNGVTTVSISCRDILRWWELTMITKNAAFLDPQGSTGGWNLFQNQFAGLNSYAVIMNLAKESMGDWSQTVGSFTSFIPEQGTERNWFNDNLSGIMLYWQAKFKNIWNNLVMYGTSGNTYQPTGINDGTVSTQELSAQIFREEFEFKKSETQANSAIKLSPNEVSAYKVEVSRAGDVSFFQPDTVNKLSVALEARDQIGYEFYCDTTGDIIFKPPFFNVNVLPNKPVSWIQDIDIIDDSITDSEGEVYTHIVSSGNAFGGVTDWGINDEFTTPRTGAYDFHLLKRYGWRKYDYQCEWAGNPRKLFYHILDYLDRLNAKRQNGNVTIPLRPELRMGFPVYIPKYDSFFYVNGLSHSYSVGGQATTTLTLMAKRSKFLAPKNIGKLSVSGYVKEVKTAEGKASKVTAAVPLFTLEFPTMEPTQGTEEAAPVILRHPKTGKLLGYPNVVMIFKKRIDGQQLAKILLDDTNKKKAQNASKSKTPKGPAYNTAVEEAFKVINSADQSVLISRIRQSRYEAGASNAGDYDYAEDVSGVIKEFQIVNLNRITYKRPPFSGDSGSVIQGAERKGQGGEAEKLKQIKLEREEINKKKKQAQKEKTVLSNEYNKENAKLKKDISNKVKTLGIKNVSAEDIDKIVAEDAELSSQKSKVKDLESQIAAKDKEIKKLDKELLINTSKSSSFIPDLSVLIRPVSDEFGFEVIGHYKYGRGAFIDRGKLKLYDKELDITTNQLNIQFAATGGLLTESVNVSDQDSLDFAKNYEIMQPDDWNTGATFNLTNSNIEDFKITTVSNYSRDIEQNSGKSVFIEVDATRKSRLLSELSPVVTTGISEAVSNCVCGVGKTNWLSLLPISIIKTVLSPSGSPTVTKSVKQGTGIDQSYGFSGPDRGLPDIRLGPDGEPIVYYPNAPKVASISSGTTSEDIANGFASANEIVVGNVDSKSFFTTLSKFLKDKFGTFTGGGSNPFSGEIYENFKRERAYSGEIRNIDADYGYLGAQSPGGFIFTGTGAQDPSLFLRAVQGDTEAQQLIKNQANYNFGMKNLNSYVDAFSQTVSNAGGIVNNAVNNFGQSTLNETFNFTTGQAQPPAQPPNFNDIVNDTFAQGPVAGGSFNKPV